MNSYTYGHWSVEIDHYNNVSEFIRASIDGEMFDVANVLDDETGNAAANARLIAAAPDLLAALQMATHCLVWHEEQHGVGIDAEALRAARAAINKATGVQS